MKTIIISLLSLLLFIAPDNLTAQYDRVEVYVDGLGCPFCAYGLEKRFKDLEGIRDIKINMENGLMTFTIEAHQGITLQDIDRQVERAGYTLTDATIYRHNGETIRWETRQESETESLSSSQIQVKGNCGMCKARIERAASEVPGVLRADWNADNQTLFVFYGNEKPDFSSLRQKIAASGHDTDQVTADNRVYENLPPCCLYRRR